MFDRSEHPNKFFNYVTTTTKQRMVDALGVKIQVPSDRYFIVLEEVHDFNVLHRKTDTICMYVYAPSPRKR